MIHEGIVLSSKKSSNEIVMIRDTPIIDKPVFLNIHKNRYYLPDGKGSITEDYILVNKHRQFTIRYELYIYEKVKLSNNIKGVSESEGISTTKVSDIYKEYSKSEKDDFDKKNRVR